MEMGMEVPARIRLFLWKLAHGILPTNMNLMCKFVDVNSFCRRYGDDLESMEHALRNCPWISGVWQEDMIGLGHEMLGGVSVTLED